MYIIEAEHRNVYNICWRRTDFAILVLAVTSDSQACDVTWPVATVIYDLRRATYRVSTWAA